MLVYMIKVWCSGLISSISAGRKNSQKWTILSKMQKVLYFGVIHVFLNEGHLDWIEYHEHIWYVSVKYTLGIQSAGL